MSDQRDPHFIDNWSILRQPGILVNVYLSICNGYLLRTDSAFYGHATISAAIKAGAAVSVTARMDPAIKKAIVTIADDAWESIEYTDAIYDCRTGESRQVTIAASSHCAIGWFSAIWVRDDRTAAHPRRLRLRAAGPRRLDDAHR